VIVRLVIVAAATVLMSWGQTASPGAIEAVRLPISCSYVANKVVLVSSPSDQLHMIVGDREHKIVRACAPGSSGKCRNWEVHRFDLLCGGRTVSWRLVAGQLLNLASLERRDALSRSHLEPWEVRTLLADPEFAPVDEFGGRILLLDKMTPQHASAKAALTTETAVPQAGPPKSEQVTISPKIEGPKTAPVSLQSEASPQQQPAAMSHQPGVPETSAEPKTRSETANVAEAAPPGGKADDKSADGMTSSQLEGSKREANSASDPEIPVADTAVSGAPTSGKSAVQTRSASAGLGTIALDFALLLVIIAIMIFGALMWWKSASSRPRASSRGISRVVYENETDLAELDADALAEACRELMKQVAAELVKAMSAVNSLKGIPALQAALHTELESIRRSLGFTPQFRVTSGEKKDWRQIRSQLALSLQGTERILGIAEAARTSFPVHPAALEVITTRLEAYAFLGVNASASEAVLKKAVNALRECWHPDLATNEEDRRLREVRIKQINVAWDLITGKQMSY
jgi:DnaJ-domain-containing protein 1